MSCAGCDDCSDAKWHLHVTVEHRKRDKYPWDTEELRAMLQQCGEKLVHVSNVFYDAKKYGRNEYYELVPTCNFSGTEMEAVRSLFDFGAWLQSMGCVVRRLKIEGDWRWVESQRVLYYEAHVPLDTPDKKRIARSLRIPASRVGDKWTATVRENRFIRSKLYMYGRAGLFGDLDRLHVEACVLDTAREIDAEWINQ